MKSKRERFVEEYLIDLNATQAAIRSGHRESSARVRGHKLLKLPDVAAAVGAAMAAQSKRAANSADRVVRELARIAFADPRDCLAWGRRACGPA